MASVTSTSSASSEIDASFEQLPTSDVPFDTTDPLLSATSTSSSSWEIPHQQQRPPRRLCRFFFAFGCSSGDDCAYSHEVPDGMTIEEARKTIPCPYYHRDACRYGDQCQLGHFILGDQNNTAVGSGDRPPYNKPTRGKFCEVIVVVPPGMEFWFNGLLEIAEVWRVYICRVKPTTDTRGTGRWATADGTTLLAIRGWEDKILDLSTKMERFLSEQQKLPVVQGDPPPDLNTLAARYQLWNVVVRKMNGRKHSKTTIRRKAKRCGIEHPLRCDLAEAEQRYKDGRRDYNIEKQKAKARTKAFASFLLDST